ncbi:hypothetical protein RCL1_000918 [Eukaryota sp. TZLM3-RCL]
MVTAPQSLSPGDVYLQKCSQFGISPRSDFLKYLRDSKLQKLSLTSEHSLLEVNAVLDALSHTSISNLRLTAVNLDQSNTNLLGTLLSSSKTLQKLVLRQVSISNSHLNDLFSFFSHSSSLQELSLSQIPLSENLVSSLCTHLSSSPLISLSLNNCELTDSCSPPLAALLNTLPMYSLILEGNHFTSAAAECFSQAFSHNTTLEEFYICGNPIGNEGVSCLAKFLVKFRTVDLRSCQIGPLGVSSLSQSLVDERSNIVALALDDNRIGSKGALNLARVLTSLKDLEELRLNNNKIGDSGAISLAYAIAMHDSLLRVELNDNLIGDKGSIALANVIQSNSKVELISLAGNYISEDCELELASMIESFSTTSNADFDVANQNDYLTVDDVHITRDLEEWYFSNRDDIHNNLKISLEKYQQSGGNNSKIVNIISTLGGFSKNLQQKFSDHIPTMIDISDENLTTIDMVALAECLRFANTISVLKFQSCRVNCQLIKILVPSLLNNSSLKQLIIRDHSILHEGAFILGQAISSSNLSELIVSDSIKFNDTAMEYLIKGLLSHSSQLTSLDFSRLGITSKSLNYLAKFLTTSKTCTDLCLDGNNLHEKFDSSHLTTLSDSIIMINSTLESLSLRSCKLSSSSLPMISSMILKSVSLKKIVLDHNSFDDDDIFELQSVANQKGVEISLRGGRSIEKSSGSPKRVSLLTINPIDDKPTEIKKIEEELSKVSSQLDALCLRKSQLIQALRSQKELYSQSNSERLLNQSLSKIVSMPVKYPPLNQISEDFKRDFDRSDRSYQSLLNDAQSNLSTVKNDTDKLWTSIKELDDVISDYLQKRSNLIDQMRDVLQDASRLDEAEEIQSEISRLETSAIKIIEKRNKIRQQFVNQVDIFDKSINDMHRLFDERKSQLSEILEFSPSSDSNSLFLNQAYAKYIEDLSQLAELRNFCNLVQERDQDSFNAWNEARNKLDSLRNTLTIAEQEESLKYEAFQQARRCAQDALRDEAVLRASLGLDSENNDRLELSKKATTANGILNELIPLAEELLQFYTPIAKETQIVESKASEIVTLSSEYIGKKHEILEQNRNYLAAKEKLLIAKEARNEADSLRQQIHQMEIQLSKIDATITTTRDDQKRARLRGDYKLFKETQMSLSALTVDYETLKEEKNGAIEDLLRLDKMGLEAEQSVVELYSHADEFILAFEKENCI